MQWQIIGIILLISIALAVVSLKRQHKMDEVKTVQEDLKKGKVLFDASDKVSDVS